MLSRQRTIKNITRSSCCISTSFRTTNEQTNHWCGCVHHGSFLPKPCKIHYFLRYDIHAKIIGRTEMIYILIAHLVHMGNGWYVHCRSSLNNPMDWLNYFQPLCILCIIVPMVFICTQPYLCFAQGDIFAMVWFNITAGVLLSRFHCDTYGFQIIVYLYLWYRGRGLHETILPVHYLNCNAQWYFVFGFL